MDAQQIKDRLKEKGLSQSELARRFGTAPNTIHYLIQGSLKSARLERRLARALGITLDELRRSEQQAKAS